MFRCHLRPEQPLVTAMFYLYQVLASNIGGTATLIGDPPNIIIGAQVGLSFNSFVVNLAPVIGVIIVVHTLGYWIWRYL